MLTALVCAGRSYVRKRRSRDAPEDSKQHGRGPSRAARTPPVAVRTQRDRHASRRRYAPALERVVRDATASLAALAAADALAGAGRALSTSRSGTS